MCNFEEHRCDFFRFITSYATCDRCYIELIIYMSSCEQILLFCIHFYHSIFLISILLVSHKFVKRKYPSLVPKRNATLSTIVKLSSDEG